MRQPFALEELASKVNLTQRRNRQDYMDNKASEATQFLSEQADKIRKSIKKSSKSAGIFGKLSKKLGIDKGILQTIIGIGANTVFPGVGGSLLNAILSGADLSSTQKDLKGEINKLNKNLIIPGRFKGTFMENYLAGNISGAQGQAAQMIQGLKDTNLLTGGASTLLSLLPVAKDVIAPKLGESLKGAFKNIAPKMVKDSPTELVENILSTNYDKLGINPAGEGLKSIPQQKFMDSVSSVLDIVKSQQSVPAQLSRLGKNLGKNLDKLNIKGINLSKLNNPLLQGSRGIEALSTPLNYAPMLENLVESLLAPKDEEPIVTALEAPKFY